MAIKKIDHVALVVRNIDDVLRLYRDVFGLRAGHVFTLKDQRVKAALLRLGEAELELIAPTDAESGVAKFLERSGEGLHHVCYESDDIQGDLLALEGKGCQLVDKEPRPGLAGMIGFVHPRSTHGALTELCEKPLPH